MLVVLPSVLAALLAASTSASTATSVDLNQRQVSRNLQTYWQPADYVGPMLERVNQERAAVGLAALCTNSKLQASAERHSNDQAVNDFMAHDGSDGSTMSERITEAGYDWSGIAENVAAGQVDVTEVMDAWMNSEGHRHNILGDYTMLGTAYAFNADGTYRHYWTQDFGKGDNEQCDGSSGSGTSTSTNANNGDSSSFGSSDGVVSQPNRGEGQVRSDAAASAGTSTLGRVLVIGIAASLLMLPR
ncbi:hypothetical protein BBJ28_00002492 [Nothophytophthora sp. Chile5]|nr:hypothetical protein BBJ28_00002492 [Nothophytophthora sp. Chile5]